MLPGGAVAGGHRGPGVSGGFCPGPEVEGTARGLAKSTGTRDRLAKAARLGYATLRLELEPRQTRRVTRYPISTSSFRTRWQLGARAGFFVWLLVATAVVPVSFACRTRPMNESPERVVEEFIDRMRRVHGDRKSARAAFDLLWSEARENLTERAKRASALVGQKVAPEEMLAPSRFSLQFEPKHYTSQTQGGWAEVTVTGEAPESQRRSVTLVRENNQWRIVLKLPPLPPIRRRLDPQ